MNSFPQDSMIHYGKVTHPNLVLFNLCACFGFSLYNVTHERRRNTLAIKNRVCFNGGQQSQGCHIFTLTTCLFSANIYIILTASFVRCRYVTPCVVHNSE